MKTGPVNPLAFVLEPGFVIDRHAAWTLDRLSSAIWVFDIDAGRVVWANKPALDIWAADDLTELAGRDMKSDMSPAVARRLEQYQNDFIQRDAVFTELWTLYPGGNPRPVRVRFSGLTFSDGRMGMLCEGTEEVGIEPGALRSADALLHTQLMISLHKFEGGTLYLNPAARSAFDPFQKDLRDRFVDHAEHAWLMQEVKTHGETSIITQIHTVNGIRWHELTVRSCLDPVSGDPSLLVSEADVSELKEAEARAQRMAQCDPLTGLPNRLALPEIFKTLSSRAEADGTRLGIFFIDLDGFKAVNDTLGHQYGDALLIQVAGRLSSICGRNDAVIRFGGDEFLVLATEERRNAGRLDGLADKILKRLAIPVTNGGRRFTCTPSVGGALFPDDGVDAETLVQCADLAMYAAKINGRNQFRKFERAMRLEMDEQLALLADLREAFGRNEFDVYYQPRYSSQTGRIVSVEALSRWNRQGHGLIAPSVFIPLCEKTGLIDQLGVFVLDHALGHQNCWTGRGIELAVSVNVSLRQLSDPAFSDIVANLLDKHRSRGSLLELELTETLLVEGSQVVHANLEAIRALGVRIAVDDFGTGYSNLARLNQMAVDCIKIDRSLIRDLPRNEALVKMVIAMCDLMGVTIVAEGIETLEVADWAKEHGCHELQGYLYGRPLPAPELEPVLMAMRQQA